MYTGAQKHVDYVGLCSWGQRFCKFLADQREALYSRYFAQTLITCCVIWMLRRTVAWSK